MFVRSNVWGMSSGVLFYFYKFEIYVTLWSSILCHVLAKVAKYELYVATFT